MKDSEREAICKQAIEEMKAEFGGAFTYLPFDFGLKMAVAIRSGGRRRAWILLGRKGGSNSVMHAEGCNGDDDFSEEEDICLPGCRHLGIEPVVNQGITMAMNAAGALQIVEEIKRQMRDFVSSAPSLNEDCRGAGEWEMEDWVFQAQDVGTARRRAGACEMSSPGRRFRTSRFRPR